MEQAGLAPGAHVDEFIADTKYCGSRLALEINFSLLMVATNRCDRCLQRLRIRFDLPYIVVSDG